MRNARFCRTDHDLCTGAVENYTLSIYPSIPTYRTLVSVKHTLSDLESIPLGSQLAEVFNNSVIRLASCISSRHAARGLMASLPWIRFVAIPRSTRREDDVRHRHSVWRKLSCGSLCRHMRQLTTALHGIRLDLTVTLCSFM